MKVLETDRLRLRWLSLNDAEFILELLNDRSWLQFIGDKGVRSAQDAQSYLLKGPIAMYARVGFGLYLTELKEGCVPIGVCGLIKRDSLEDVDIGFAYLPRYWSKGYAYESASAMMAYARNVLGLRRIVAITSPENAASTKLLGKLGLRFEKMVKLPHEPAEICLYASDA
ncbi:MAG: GNAT family N-acetyltransferase [Betaproteobacteria bacterium]